MASFVVQGKKRPPRASWPAHAVPRYESLPVEPLVTVLIFFLCVPALGRIVPAVAILALGAILALRWRSAPRMVAASAIFFLLPVFAILSGAWSEVPGTSVRYGVQLAITFLIAVVIARTVPARRIALLVWIAVTLASLIGIASGRAGASADGAVLIGLAGSKNQMGYISLFWLIASLALLIDRKQYLLLRLATLPCSALAIFMIWQGDAMTALVSAVVAVFLIVVFGVAGWFSRGGRLFLLFAGLLMGIGMVAAGPQITAAAERFGTDVLHKDSTLTGRTLLWEYADTLIAKRPVLGYGYKGIWLGPIGVGLLERMGQTDGRAFHFHDTFREVEADLGYVGLACFLLPFLVGAAKMGFLLLDRPTPARIFMATTLLIVALRMRTELVLAPFLLDTVLLTMVLVYAWADKIAVRARPTITNREARTAPIRKHAESPRRTRRPLAARRSPKPVHRAGENR